MWGIKQGLKRSGAHKTHYVQSKKLDLTWQKKKKSTHYQINYAVKEFMLLSLFVFARNIISIFLLFYLWIICWLQNATMCWGLWISSQAELHLHNPQYLLERRLLERYARGIVTQVKWDWCHCTPDCWVLRGWIKRIHQAGSKLCWFVNINCTYMPNKILVLPLFGETFWALHLINLLLL